MFDKPTVLLVTKPMIETNLSIASVCLQMLYYYDDKLITYPVGIISHSQYNL